MSDFMSDLGSPFSEPSRFESDNPDTHLSSYHYDLPEGLIAQTPMVPRDRSRLLVVDGDEHRHHIFRDLTTLLQPGDLLILNNTRVIPARLLGHKMNPTLSSTPSIEVEVFLLEPKGELEWLTLVKPGRRLKPGAIIEFGAQDRPLLRAEVLATDRETRGRFLKFSVLDPTQTFEAVLQTLGQVPLPPYIQSTDALPEQYQTVYATASGSVAAPTAGLHFTPELLDALNATGIDCAQVTLHVGIGTFRPVEAECITDHTMHSEWVEISEETVQKIQDTQARGGRIIAVGTTAVRSLEGVATQFGRLQPYQDRVNLFIYPGYKWKVIDGLITNFHLPRSSLLMLVSALVGRERLLNLYETAIAERYRFYSFGDAMLILPTQNINLT